ncbi:hypothetical protein [Massilia glaciei]|uniref:hypothetical protein n=1 Tax=Massilia glaciei TaxID=1524097 RepID=UPI0015E81F9A|nr:hypothetical protein [Massilia glaciei]
MDIDHSALRVRRHDREPVGTLGFDEGPALLTGQVEALQHQVAEQTDTLRALTLKTEVDAGTRL